MTADQLRESLLGLAPVELIGMKLLRDTPHHGWFPFDVPRETLKAAVVELIDYSERCQHTARQLSKLTPIPVIGVDLWEYAL